MHLNLQKNQDIELKNDSGEAIRKVCVGINWGAIQTSKPGLFGIGTKKGIEKVDIDLSCVMLNNSGELVDWIYSPKYNDALLKNNLPMGKFISEDGSMQHSGDDLKGDVDEDDGLDNEIIMIDLDRVSNTISKIFFFTNIYSEESRDINFSQIPFAKIRMYEGTAVKIKNVFSDYDIVTDSTYSDKGAIILAKLYRKDKEWRFNAIGDPTDDKILIQTIQNILHNYK